MKKNVILMAIITIFLTASTIFAQQKTGNFLGTWKLAETNNWTNELNIKSMTITVTETDKDLIIERNTQKPDISFSAKNIYKTSGATTTSLVGGRLGGLETQFLRFVKDNKLELLWGFQGEKDGWSNREIWTVSENGKTLTVLQKSQYVSGKLVFTKQ
jgi:hypothetical protein